MRLLRFIFRWLKGDFRMVSWLDEVSHELVELNLPDGRCPNVGFLSRCTYKPYHRGKCNFQ